MVLGLAALVAAKMWTLITPWSQSRASLGGDFGLAVEPYFYHMLKQGTIPLWDPTIATGSPFLGAGTHHPMFLQAHLHLFYPVNLLWLGLAERDQFIPHAVLQYHHAFHYWLAGVFMYGFGRQLALGRYAAGIAAIAFMFSGFLLGHLMHWTAIDTVVWLPLVLACLHRADATGRRRWGVGAGVALGVAFLAGHPQIFYYVGLAAVAFGLTLLGRRLAGGEPWGRAARALALVPVVALGVAAVQLLPSFELAVGSHRAGLDYDWKAVGSLHPHALFQFVLPWGLLGIEGWRDNVSEFYLYAGLLPLLAAVYALARRRDWCVAFHAALGLGALLLAFGEGYGLHRVAFHLLPGLSLFRVPARALALVSFAVAALAGLGVQAFLAGPRPRGVLRPLGLLAAGLGLAGVPVYLLLIRVQGTPAADTFQRVADQYALAALLFAVVLAVVAWAERGASPRLVRWGLLGALLLDLLFGSAALESAAPDPDRSDPADERIVAFLEHERQPIRLGRGARLAPRVIYRHGWGVFDGESTFAPPPFLDLYGLAETNPRIVDLLDVKYVIGLPPTPALQPRVTGPMTLSAGARRRIPLADPGPVRQIELESHLVYGLDVPQGTAVGSLYALGQDGAVQAFPLRAGIETAEWALDRPQARPGHARPPVARSWTDSQEGFQGHDYRATFTLPPAFRPSALVVEHAKGNALLVVDGLRLDGREPAPLPERFRRVDPDVFENRYALPRAFVVRRARRLPAAEVLEAMKTLDPEEEVLVSEALPAGWPAAGPPSAEPAPPVRFLEYGPDRIRMETTTADPAFLVLSDTYHRRWLAWDNGRPARILRADHALRALALPAGHHVVELRYRQPSVWVGLGISLATWAGLGVGAVLVRRRQARRLTAGPAGRGPGPGRLV